MLRQIITIIIIRIIDQNILGKDTFDLFLESFYIFLIFFGNPGNTPGRSHVSSNVFSILDFFIDSFKYFY